MQFNGCYFPDDVLYSKDMDLWFRPEEGGLISGMTASVLWICGRRPKVRVKEKGSHISAGASLASVECDRYFGTLRIPFGAGIVKVNTGLENGRITPSSIYDDHWLCMVSADSLDEVRQRLIPASEAENLIESKISELRLQCFSELPDADMVEIGSECSAVLARLNSEIGARGKGAVIHLITDDPTSPVEMIRWSDETGNEIVERKKVENIYHYIVRKS